MKITFCVLAIAFLAVAPLAADDTWPPEVEPLIRVVDLNVGESSKVTLSDGSVAEVKLLDLQETRDSIRNAVREAIVTVEVNGEKGALSSGHYRLPVLLGGVQVDCAVTKGFVQPESKTKSNPWALDKDARLRFWPAGKPWIQPGTFMYPAKQRWFATYTQMANESVYVDGCEVPSNKDIYYHYGLDIGGADGLVEIVAATDAVVVSSGKEVADSPPPCVRPRYDVVYMRDGRGWYYRYSHLDSIDPAMKVGAKVKMGQKVGILGKEGSSGGWSHLHFDINGIQPSGRYGIIEGYAFIWQAYHNAAKTQLQAVARPHRVAFVGEKVTLDGSLSWSVKGPEHISAFEWQLSDGTKANGQTVSRAYDKPGKYSEILKVTDADGLVDYDFCLVEIFDRENPEPPPHAIHAAYYPTVGLRAGDEITFLVRSFEIGPTEGHERWDFGDGSPTVEVQSDGCAKKDINAKDGYVRTKHSYAKPGHYLVSVSRTNNRGETATAHLHVRVE